MLGCRLPAMGLLLLCAACVPVRTPAPVVPAFADPAAMTYRSTWLPSGEVTLVQGLYREAAAPGSAAEFVVSLTGPQLFGRFDGKDAGVVILVTQAGGTGSFYDLALLLREGSGWVNRDVVPLGDRVDIQALASRDNRVVVTMVTQGPEDPLCCPTLRVERSFAVQGDKLVAVGQSTLAPPPTGLVGTVWRWVQTLYNNDTLAVPPRPESYTVQFGPDGTVNVRADCNRKGGRYSVEDQQVAIEITHSTRAACPENSLEEQFVRDLTGAAVWFLEDGDLYIDIKFDSGTMRLQE